MTLRRWATWAWVGAYFLSTVVIGGQIWQLPAKGAEIAALTWLACLSLAVGATRRAANRVVFGFVLLGIPATVYNLLQPHREWGSSESYLVSSLGFVLIYGLTATYAALFFERRQFLRVFERVARISLLLALAAFFVARATPLDALVNTRLDTTTVRLLGTLAEPSSWAPVLGALFLLAMRARNRRYAGLVLVASVLTFSPTVFLVLVASCVVYLLLAARWRSKKPLVIAATMMLVAASVQFIETADPLAWSNRHDAAGQTIGKLLSGIETVRSGGTVGQNARFTSTELAFEEIRALGVSAYGYGPDAHIPYFAAKYPPERGAFRGASPNAIWVVAAFNFGTWAAIAVIVVMALALIRLRTDKDLLCVLLPFCLASLVNSAGGPELYKFVVLTVLVAAFRLHASGRSVSP